MRYAIRKSVVRVIGKIWMPLSAHATFTWATMAKSICSKPNNKIQTNIMTTTYKGIDYGLGRSNVDLKNGIRYGVIPTKRNIMSNRERELISAMRNLDYACTPMGNSFILTPLPICQPFVNCTAPLPYIFKSIQSAADYLCPIVRDAAFTEIVSQINHTTTR